MVRAKGLLVDAQGPLIERLGLVVALDDVVEQVGLLLAWLTERLAPSWPPTPGEARVALC